TNPPPPQGFGGCLSCHPAIIDFASRYEGKGRALQAVAFAITRQAQCDAMPRLFPSPGGHFDLSSIPREITTWTGLRRVLGTPRQDLSPRSCWEWDRSVPPQPRRRRS